MNIYFITFVLINSFDPPAKVLENTSSSFFNYLDFILPKQSGKVKNKKTEAVEKQFANKAAVHGLAARDSDVLTDK